MTSGNSVHPSTAASHASSAISRAITRSNVAVPEGVGRAGTSSSMMTRLTASRSAGVGRTQAKPRAPRASG